MISKTAVDSRARCIRLQWKIVFFRAKSADFIIITSSSGWLGQSKKSNFKLPVVPRGTPIDTLSLTAASRMTRPIFCATSNESLHHSVGLWNVLWWKQWVTGTGAGATVLPDTGQYSVKIL